MASKLSFNEVLNLLDREDIEEAMEADDLESKGDRELLNDANDPSFDPEQGADMGPGSLENEPGCDVDSPPYSIVMKHNMFSAISGDAPLYW